MRLTWEPPCGLSGGACHKDSAGFGQLDTMLHTEALESLADVEKEAEVIEEEEH